MTPANMMTLHTQTSIQTDLIQMQKQQLTFAISEKIGEAKGLLHAEKMQLESEERKLQNDITQLASVQIAEFNSAVDNNYSRREMIVQRLKTIVHQLKKQSERKCAGIPPNTQPFKALIASINQYSDVRTYPNFSQIPKDTIPLHSETALVSFDPLLDLCKTDPTLLSLTQSSICSYEAIKNELVPLKTANLALIDQKKVMIENHNFNMIELHRKERELRLRVVLETVRSIHARMKWSTPLLPFDQCTNCIWEGDREGLGSRVGPIKHARQLEVLNKKLKKIEDLVKDLIATIEGFVNPKETT